MSGIVEKTFVYRVYNSAGEFMGEWADVVSDFQLTQNINSAGAALQVTLARSIDDALNTVSNLVTEDTDNLTTEDSDQIIVDTQSRDRVGAGTDVDVNNRVDVYLFYGANDVLINEAQEEILAIVSGSTDNIILIDDHVNGKLVFTGKIEEYEAVYGDEDSVLVTILSDGAELDHYLVKNGSATTRTFSSQDPSTILKTILDSYGGVITYDSGTIHTTGTTVSYTFKINTVLEAVKKCLELAPADWFWYVDVATKKLYFRTRTNETTHLITLGSSIKSLRIKRTMNSIRNLVYFLGGDTGGGTYLYKTYNDATSITSYGQRLERITDQRVTDSTSAGIISNSVIDDLKNPRYSGEVTLVAGAYEIEQIRLGHKIEFRNFDNFLDGLTLLVVGYTYNVDTVTLRMETLPPTQNQRLEDIKRNLQREETINVPTTPS